MVTPNDLARLRTALERRITTLSTSLFGWTLTSKSSALGDEDRVEKSDGTDPGSTQKGQRPTTRVVPFGLATRRPTGLRALWARLGASNLFELGIGPQETYGPQDLEEGEVSLYCKADGTRVWLDANGAIHVDAASGQDVIVNGGSAKVGRVGDKCRITGVLGGGPLAGWMQQVEVAINLLAPSSITPLSTTFTADPGITIADGAANFKG